MIEIKSRFGDRVLYRSKSARDLRTAVEEAVRKKVNLAGADLTGGFFAAADFRGADLAGAYLAGADLTNAYLADGYFAGADFRGANFIGADLKGGCFLDASLEGVDFRRANLAGADFDGVRLAGADFDSADGITFSAGPSGYGHLLPLDAQGMHDRNGEWCVSIGCWDRRTLRDLRALIADEAEWPEATGAERDRRRPYLRAVLALCAAHIAYQKGETRGF